MKTEKKEKFYKKLWMGVACRWNSADTSTVHVRWETKTGGGEKLDQTCQHHHFHRHHHHHLNCHHHNKNHINQEGGSPLMAAAQAGHLDVVEALIGAGASPSKTFIPLKMIMLIRREEVY